MAGRVHGRVAGRRGRTSSATGDLVFEQLRPTPPEFQLAGDAERVAITCAALGVDAARPRPAGAARPDGLPAGAGAARPTAGWSRTAGSPPTAARSRRCRWSGPGASCWCTPTPSWCRSWRSAANIDSLHRMTREERDLHGVDRQRERSPHRLQPLRRGGEPARLPGRGVRAAAAPVRGGARRSGPSGAACWSRRSRTSRSASASVYRALELPLPEAAALRRRRSSARQFADLLARVMPFDLVIDEHTADGQEARVSKTSVAGSWGAVAGTLRYFADRFGDAARRHRGHHHVLRPGARVRRARAAEGGAERARASTRGSPSSGG